MSPSSLAELQALKYAELRTLCKENNLKASGKTDALVAQLAEHFGFTDEDDNADKPAPAPPVKAAPNRRTVAGTSKGKNRKVSHPKEAEVEEVQDGAKLATPVKSQEKIVYMTSPGTKANVIALLATVKDLQTQLSCARTSLTALEATVAAPRSPTLKRSDVVSLIDRKIFEHRQAMSAELEKRFTGVSEQLNTVKQDVETDRVEHATQMEALRAQLSDSLNDAAVAKAVIEESINSLRADLTSRLLAPETQPAQKPPASSPAVPDVAASPRSRKVSFADPMEDAPPTRSVSFSSPSSPAATPISSSTPGRSSLAVGSRKATPFRLNTLDTSSSSTPASALPSHMLATAASAAKRSPRPPRTSAPASLQEEPRSPAGLPPKPTIGKRTRHSDASEVSVELAALDSPVAEGARGRATITPGSNNGGANVVSPGRRLSEILASVSASGKKDDDHHARKRMRVSSGSIIDHGYEAEGRLDSEDDEEDEDFQDSFEGSEETEDSFEDNDNDDVEEENSVREYLVALKTGDEEPTALKPAPRASTGSTVSIHDPSFFAAAAAPVSPASRRVTLDGPAVKENTAPSPSPVAAPSSARKSLPMASLPCPIVSPYTASKTKLVASAPNSTKKPVSTTATPFSFGTPSTIANRRITIGPAASARKTTPAASARATPYSATPAKRTANAPGSARKATPSAARTAATPPAARTLFGSERIVAPSSARSAATSQARTAYEGQSEDDEGESRFGDDGFSSALTSPQKGGWGILTGGSGMFGRS
ncbi:hypothetical protein JCM11251_004436 [Rhodosporidiobolus azoricus]